MNPINVNKQILKEGQYSGIIEKIINVEGAIVSKTCYVAHNKPEWHCHENMHIALIFQKAKSETRRQEYYTQNEGDILFYHSAESHKYTTYDTISYGSNIEISLPFIKKYNLTELNIKKHVYNNAHAKSLILSMQHELLIKDPCISSNIYSLLLELVAKPNLKFKSKPKWATQLDEVLREYWYKPFSLRELSNMIGVHPITISKNFRRYFSYTLGEYRRKIKIEKSISLIKSSSMSLSEIAHFCQFSDQSHFIRNFKKYTGFLPSAFGKF